MRKIRAAKYTPVLMLICIGVLSFEVLPQTYNRYLGKEIRSFSYSESRLNGEFKIILSSKERTEICILDSNYNCLKWIYKSNLNSTNFTATRISDSIHITGAMNGSEFNSAVKIGEKPWLQFWEFGIANMLTSGKNEMAFYSIDANKPSKIAIFLVKRKEFRTIRISNRDEDVNHIEINIKGLPTIIFTANMWFRKSDNVFLKSEIPEGPFVPITRIEIQN